MVWGGIWLTLGFILLESAAVWFHAPWPTFSRTVWSLQQRWPWLTVPVVAVLAILGTHLARLKGIEEGDPELKAEVEQRSAKERK